MTGTIKAAVSGKLMPLEELAIICAQLNGWGKRIILCHGTFDIVHPGHIEHLRQAKAMGDLLVVTLTSDAHVVKGPGRPVFNHNQRALFMSNLQLVDYVSVVNDRSAIPAINAVRPLLYVKGQDYADRTDGTYALEKEAVEAVGGTVAFTSGITDSSSRLANAFLEARPPHIEEYLKRVRQKYSASDMLGWLARIPSLRILVYGEPIIDEYVYVMPAGKSAKDSVIVWIPENGREVFQGGSMILAAHLSALGGNPTQGPDWSPIIKRRYVERTFGRKVFSLAVHPDIQARPQYPSRDGFYDVTIVADYGHGLFPSQQACRAFYGFGNDRPFTALTVQANSLNWGYNRLTKWPQADYAVVDKEELHLACGVADWDGYDMDWWAEHERRRLSAKVLAVTLGHEGCAIYCADGKVIAPALASRVVDRMGAGDAFLAVTAPLVYLDAPADIVAFLGSVVAGIKVGMLGNKPIEKGVVHRWIKSLLS